MAQQGQQGDFAAMAAAMGQTPGASQAMPTPAASPTQDAPPTGLTPNAKRPMNRDSVQVANTGSRLMSQEDLSAGFYNLASLQTRDEAFTKNVASCVDYNGKLLNELVTRVNTLEASRNLNTTKVDELTVDVRSALETVEKGDLERDKNLRAELSAMATRLEEGHAELQRRLPSSGRPPWQPLQPARLRLHQVYLPTTNRSAATSRSCRTSSRRSMPRLEEWRSMLNRH